MHAQRHQSSVQNSKRKPKEKPNVHAVFIANLVCPNRLPNETQAVQGSRDRAVPI
jgi:hypothetical protein